jgi:stress-induced morphogen
MSPDELKAALERAFPGARVEVQDLTGTKDHYEVSIVAAAFAGKSRIEQHKMVYAALGKSVGGVIHALALKTSAG